MKRRRKTRAEACETAGARARRSRRARVVTSASRSPALDVVPDSTIAVHEAGHAVMRWLRRTPAGAVYFTADGGGRCDGDGRRIDVESSLLINLAGFAAELGFGIFGWPESMPTGVDDIERARELLSGSRWLRYRWDGSVTPPGVTLDSVDDALLRHMARAGDMLCVHCDLVERIAERLEVDRAVSARSVAALCREHGRRFNPT